MPSSTPKVQKLALANFACFEKTQLAFSPGINVLIGENGTGKTRLLTAIYASSKSKDAIFIPPQEFLSRYTGFLSGYAKGELSFDAIYNDFALALNALELRNCSEVAGFLDFISETIGGAGWKPTKLVFQAHNHFYFNLPEGTIDVHRVSGGESKLGALYYLLKNGSLTKNSILFWDTPEANLNPQWISRVAKLLHLFAAAGMQIFIATHDYILSHELSLLAEYWVNPAVDFKFFALSKPNRKSSVVIGEGKALFDLKENPILAEYSAHYEREAMLFNK